MGESTNRPDKRRARRALLFIPLAAFASLAIFLAVGLTEDDRSSLPSALIGEPFPSFESTTLEHAESVTENRLHGTPRLVNVWATWCESCLREHQTLMGLSSEHGVSIVGINYRDDREAAIAWLQHHGNPYDFVIFDPNGELGIELGVYGAPETFLVDSEGLIRFKHIGEVTMLTWTRDIGPLIEELGST